MGGKTSAASKNKYIKNAYDRINFVMPKGRKAEINAEAERCGMSAAAWINEAIVEKMGRFSLEAEQGTVKPEGIDLNDIKDLEAYARSVSLSVSEYVHQAVCEKMARQDQHFTEKVERVREEF